MSQSRNGTVRVITAEIPRGGKRMVPMSVRPRSRSPRGSSGNKRNVLFVGNPGVGKSTILNGLIGEPKFKSSVSLDGKGVTFQFDKHEVAGRVYMDTPGLSNEEARKEAAAAITKALRQGGHYKVIFVVTEMRGRVIPDDKATMKLVLAAAPITAYSVIVNQVTPKWKGQMQNKEQWDEWLTTFMTGLEPQTGRVFLNVRDSKLEDEQDVKYDAAPDLRAFVENAPGMDIKTSEVTPVRADLFEQERERLEAQLTALRNNATKMTEAITKLQTALQTATKYDGNYCVATEDGCNNVNYHFFCTRKAAISYLNTRWVSRILFHHKGPDDWDELESAGMGAAHGTIRTAFSDKWGHRARIPP